MYRFFQRFIQGYCQYEGTSLEHFDGLTAEKCQMACKINSRCQTFAFDASSDVSNCELYGTVISVSCDMIRGPAVPDYSTCPQH
jgi:hypothetical protein